MEAAAAADAPPVAAAAPPPATPARLPTARVCTFRRVLAVGAAAISVLLLLSLLTLLLSSRLEDAAAGVRGLIQPAVVRLSSSVDELVCITSADPILLPTSRGTAEALWQLAVSLAHTGVRTHLILISQSTAACADSLHQILLHSWESGERVTASCVHIGGDKEAALPLITRERFVRHWAQLPSACQVLISHEWWAPVLDFLTAHEVGGHAGLRPTTIVNFHGGNLWSSSWMNGSVKQYSDYMLDANERMSAFLNDYLVFPNMYMQAFHADWVHSGARFVIPNIALGLEMGLEDRDANKELPVLGVGAPARAPREHSHARAAYVGSVEVRKGIDVLVTTLASLKELRRVRLEVFGSLLLDVHGMNARAWIKRELKTAPHVHCTIHGPQDAYSLWQHLHNEKLMVVMPTLLENQPMTLIQAHLHSVPIISYDVGGIADMLEPESRRRVIIPPSADSLRTELARALRSGVGYAPKLRPQMMEAHASWVALVRRSLSEYKQRAAEAANASASAEAAAELAPEPVMVSLRVAGGEAAGALAAALAERGSSDLVLLQAPGFAPLAGEAAAARRAAAAVFASPKVAGFSSSVRMPDGSVMVPQAPYYLLSDGWYNCAPAAPLVVRRGLLDHFLETHAALPFQTWLFALWLIYNREEAVAVLNLPQPLYSYSSCLDARSCFWAEEAMEAPAAILADMETHSRWPVPPARVVSRLARFDANFSGLLLDECAEARSGSAWAAAALAPSLCPGSVEHGLFTMRALKTALLGACGGYCLFLPGEHPATPTSTMGWALDTGDSCWREVASTSACQPWFAVRPRTPAAATDCFAPGPLAAPEPPPTLPAADPPPPCDLLLQPSEFAPAGKCAPRLLIAGFHGCGVGAVGEALRAHPGAPADPPPSQAEAAARRAYYELDAEAMRSAGARWRFASSFQGEPWWDDSLASAPPRAQLPAQLRQLWPAARVLLLVCDPVQRAAAEWAAREGRLGVAALRRHRLHSLSEAAAAALNGSLSSARVQPDSPFYPGSVQQALLETGYYVLRLFDWLHAFGPSRVLVLPAERLAGPSAELRAATAAQLYAFAGLAPLGAGAEGEEAPPPPPLLLPPAVDAASAEALMEAYRTYNRWLADQVGDDYPLRWGPQEARSGSDSEVLGPELSEDLNPPSLDE